MALSTTNSAAPLFTGEYRHAIDGKSRLTVPSNWRFEEEAEFFLIPTTNGNCLKAMPRLELERIRGLADLMTDGQERANVLRVLGSSARQCRLDKAGRLVVPEDFCNALNLSGEVTLAGAMETFEIWNTKHWDATKPKTAVTATPHLARFGL